MTDETQTRADEGARPARTRLQRLKINHFRRVRPGTELRFDDDVNVVLGRNGTGKTTLLELVVAVSVGDLRAYERESFDLEFDVEASGYSFCVAVRNEHNREGSDPFGHRVSRSGWSYAIVFEYQGQQKRIEGSPQSLTRGAGLPSLFEEDFVTAAILSAEAEDQAAILTPLSVRLMRERRALDANCVRLDEGLDVFRQSRAHTPIGPGAVVLEALLIAPAPGSVVLDQVYAKAGYIPASLLSVVRTQPDASQHTELHISHHEWAPLATFSRLIGAVAIQLSLHLLDRNTNDGILNSTFGKPVFHITTPDGTTFTHDKLSYGEKRLLAFLYHAAANPNILVADELVNGLHYEWIEACLDAIEGQAFLSSQNPLLLDHLTFSSAKEAERRFVLCSTTDDGEWVWRNMNSDEAESFFSAYEVGVQHVSGILRTKGMW